MFRLPLHEIEFTYARSSGPGGQNVNKTNTKAVARWNVMATQALPWDVKERVLGQVGSRLNEFGELVIASDRFRDQIRNREDCLEKIAEIIARAWTPPKQRKKTRPTRSSQRKRRDEKGKRSHTKALRQKRVERDD